MSFVSTQISYCFNYESWKVDADNLVRFKLKGIYANNLELSKVQAALGYTVTVWQTNAPHKLTSKDFNMETIQVHAAKDDLEIREH
jgi:hypothetical protein